MDLISLAEQNWYVAPQNNGTEFPKSTVATFATEMEFKNFEENKRNKG